MPWPRQRDICTALAAEDAQATLRHAERLLVERDRFVPDLLCSLHWATVAMHRDDGELEREIVAALGDGLLVPRISEFYGIVIAMYYREHGVPHFHATSAGETVVVSIQTGDVIAGSIPARALRLVREWSEAAS